jgi:biotin/methionine sulfoxide reductase
VVHEQYWTAQAKFADIVLPATTSLEREDIGSASNDGFMIAMRQHIAPFADARDDYAIFSGLAARLGFGEAYTEGRDVRAWLEVMYEQSRPVRGRGIALPPFDTFWQQGVLEFSRPVRPQILLKDFRDDPLNAPLATPSGKIELFRRPLPILATKSVRGIRTGTSRRRNISRRSPANGRCICSPANRVPACTASTTTAA